MDALLGAHGEFGLNTWGTVRHGGGSELTVTHCCYFDPVGDKWPQSSSKKKEMEGFLQHLRSYNMLILSMRCVISVFSTSLLGTCMPV